jgi:hypothetical protein
MLVAASMASQSTLHSRTGAGMEDVAEMAKQMIGLGWKTSTNRFHYRARIPRLG